MAKIYARMPFPGLAKKPVVSRPTDIDVTISFILKFYFYKDNRRRTIVTNFIKYWKVLIYIYIDHLTTKICVKSVGLKLTTCYFYSHSPENQHEWWKELHNRVLSSVFALLAAIFPKTPEVKCMRCLEKLAVLD